MTARPRIHRRWVLAVAVAGLGLAACVPLKQPPPEAPAAPALEKYEVRFDEPGPHNWLVPAGVHAAEFILYGAQGGGTPWRQDGGARGARVRATLAVTPGAVVSVNVGAQGEFDRWDFCGVAIGGWNGGGDGGRAPWYWGGGGGGGATDVRLGGDTLDHRELVAAGGGGAGAGSGNINGQGWGGDPVGSPGHDGTTPGVEGGLPATQGTWGGGGWGNPTPSADGTPGDVGHGGAGGGDLAGCPDPDTEFFGGGGGGGGYYGGGGGGGDAAPGGEQTHAAGGGGGSSYGPPNASMGLSAHEGHGFAVITYSP